MAIFGSKKNKKEVNDIRVPAKATIVAGPRITEKATIASDKNVYTYEVDSNATKHTVRKHIIDTYGKTPVKVNVSTLPAKKRKKGTKAEVKKAYVFLKKGDTIDFIS